MDRFGEQGRNAPPDVGCGALLRLFEGSRDAMMIAEAAGAVLLANGAACGLFGFDDPRAFRGVDFHLFFGGGTAERLPELLKQENLERGITADVMCVERDGGLFPARLATTLVDLGDGRVLRLARIEVRYIDPPRREMPDDIDALGLSDFLPTMTSEPEMVAETDLSGRITSINRICTEKTGYTLDNIFDGLTIFDVFQGDTDVMRDNVEAVLRGGTIEGKEYLLRTRHGDLLPIIASVTRVMSGGAVSGLRAVALDITEHKNTERELLILEKLRSMGELAGGVIHDFNNILTMILGYTDMHAESCGNPACADIMDKINRAAQDGSAIVRRIQTYSRIHDEQEGIDVDINDVVNDVVELLSPKWKRKTAPGGKSITVELNLSPVPPVRASAHELREMLSNFFINAIDAIHGEGTITITTGCDSGGSENGAFVVLRIADTGLGMSGEVRRRLFEPFFTTKDEKGTGLGMSVSAGIIKQLGGDLNVDSTEGEGSVVTVFLPASGPPPAEAPEPEETPADAGGANILVVDDEENILEILREFLENEGYAVRTAADGAQGLEAFRGGAFDLVITDLNMPELSGWELARGIHALSPGMRIILLSGWGAEIEERNRTEQLVDIILPKPINFAELVANVGRALGRE